jgi:pimeloyl-ACP methyl ester carboxylesterase
MALAAPQAVIGIHVTDIGYHQRLETTPDDLSPAEQRFLTEAGEAFMSGGGYVAIQATRPQTLAYGLTDSPVGMAAWILDKFHDWSDCGEDFAQCYPMDELLTNLSIYWFTGTIDSSIQGYYEELHDPSLRSGEAIPVPVGMALFPKDGPPPREFAERMLGQVDHWTEMPRGGHFTAWEAPEPFAADLRAFYRSLRPS